MRVPEGDVWVCYISELHWEARINVGNAFHWTNCRVGRDIGTFFSIIYASSGLAVCYSGTCKLVCVPLKYSSFSKRYYPQKLFLLTFFMDHQGYNIATILNYIEKVKSYSLKSFSRYLRANTFVRNASSVSRDSLLILGFLFCLGKSRIASSECSRSMGQDPLYKNT